MSVREHAQRRVGAGSQPHLRRTRGPWYSDHHRAVHLGNQADVHQVGKFVSPDPTVAFFVIYDYDG